MAPRKLTEEQRERKRERDRQRYREKRDKRLLLTQAPGNDKHAEGSEAPGPADCGNDAGGAHHGAPAKLDVAAEPPECHKPAKEGRQEGLKVASKRKPLTPEQRQRSNELQRARRQAGSTPEKRQRSNELRRARRQAGSNPQKRQRSNELRRARRQAGSNPQKRQRSNELRRARRQQALAAARATEAEDYLEEERVTSPIPILWSSRDDGFVYDSEADSEPESLGGDIDDPSSEEEGDNTTARTRESNKPNDPLIVAAVRVQVDQALAGVCAARCFVCDRILNARARRRINMEKLKDADRQAVTELMDRIVTVPGEYDMCATCHRYVAKKTVPVSAAVNGFRYPTVPPGLRPLTEVEEHIVALRLPFQQIMHLGTMGTRGQYGVRGSVVNVPNDAQDTVRTVIPLLPEEDRLCVVNIKRKLVHKRAFASSFVDKENLVQWCRFLRNSTLYREHKVTFDEDRLLDSPVTERPAEPTTNNEGELFFDQPDEPANQEEMFQRFGSIQHSLLMEDRVPAVAPLAAVVPRPAAPGTAGANPDSPSGAPASATPTPAPGPSRANPDTDEVDVAPGEHKTPISVVWDRKAEELSFPAIYLGEPRIFSGRVTRYQAMRSEVRRFDRRGARPVSVLYKYNLHAREQASSRLRHKFKRGARHVLGASITKEQLLDDNFVATSQKKGLAMPCLLPNSSEYWRGRAHDLFAMVRQLKRPHLFFTQSFSETNCKPLMQVLRKLHREHGEMDRASAANIDSNVPLPDAVGAVVMEAISDLIQREDAGDDIMASQEKLKLVREDPIVCAMMFREIVLQLKKYLRLKNKGPMGKYYMTDWFIRIEFQQRGAPHCHALLWLNEGPDNPLDDIEEAVRFADELLTCDSTHPLADRNRHNHTTTCFRKKNIQRRFRLKQLDPREAHRHCRFDAPFWPTPRTRILFPLYFDKDDRPEEDRGDCSWEDYIKNLRELRMRLKDVLSSSSCPDTLEAVWREAGCPDDRTYELAIRTGLKHVKIIYKRAVQDRWTNSFLRWVLDVVGFNADAQVVLDVYSLVRYCVSYVTKAEKNHSQLHNEITTLRREHAFDDRTLMRMLASRCLRAKETSAQEASWVLLNFPLSEMSRKCTFIDTSLPDDRHHCPKPKHDIAAMPDGATDLWYPDVFDMYSNRHKDLESTTLAEFVAVHHQSSNKARKKDRIIRYRRFNEHGDDKDQRENFYRGMCTLHVPWRDEQQEILSAGTSEGGFEGLYERHEPKILQGRARFEAMLGLEADMEDELQNVVAEDEEEANEAAEAARRQLAGDGKYVFDEAEFMDAGAQDIDVDLPEPRFDQPRSDPVATVRRRGIWDRETYLSNIRRLNRKQREVVLAVYDGVRLNSEPLLLFIDGAAGTGKSVVAQCCANAFDTFAAPTDKSSDTRVISCAPTGKAACVIGGMTIHHSHSLSYNQEAGATERLHDGDGPVMRPLQGQRLANLQTFFQHVEAQLIDEISMVSDRNFLAIDQRCKEAKGKETDFGGLWTIVFGDFRQLTPVGGSAVYVSSTTEVTGSAALWQKFQYVELTENMRQGEDKKYAELLAIIGNAEQSLSDADCALLQSRFVEENNLVVPTDVLRLYHLNADKDTFNKGMLLRAEARKIFRLNARDRLQTKPTYQGCLAGQRRRREQTAETILQRAADLDVAKAHGLPYELLAVVGRPYKLTYNQDTADHLVNGAVGTLVWVQLGVLSEACLAPGADSTLAVQKLWVRFPGNSGNIASRAAAAELRRAIDRQKNLPGDLVDRLPFDLPPCPVGDELHGLVPIERRDLPLRKLLVEKWRQVLRQQFPLTPAFADTIHSSQGSSYDAACIKYDPGMTNEMVYVALSRVRALKGVWMTYSKKSKSMRRTRDGRVTKQTAPAPRLFIHPKIRNANHPLKKERDRLRTMTFVPRWAGLLQRPPGSLRAVFHNVQSLRAHHPDISLDMEVFMAADIMLLAETWLRPEDHIDLGHGMLQVARCDMATTAPGHVAGGVAIYSRLPLTQKAALNTVPHIEAVSAEYDDLLLVAMYCHPSACVDDIIQAIDMMLPGRPLPRTTILCADFNKEMQQPAGQRIVHALTDRTLTATSSLTAPTTYGAGSTIDAAFSNAAAMTVGTYQAYFSHHLPLVIDVPK